MPRLVSSVGPYAPLVRAYTANQTAYPTEATLLAANLAVDGVADGLFVFNTVTGIASGDRIWVMPFGVGTAAQTFKTAVVLFHKTATGLYVPTGACEFTCTLGALVGQAGYEVGTGEKFCDVISSPVKGTAGVDCQQLAPVAGTAGGFWVDRKAAHAFALRFTIAGGSATSGNALVGSVPQKW